MKLYNILDCEKELNATDYRTESEKDANKHFRVFDKVNNIISIAINKRGAMQAIAEKLSNRVGGDTPHGINLKYYAASYNYKVVPYDDPDEITAEELSDTETAELNATLEWLLDFSSSYSVEFYYMVEWGNGYTELSAAAYNFYAYTQHEKRLPDDMPEYMQKWICAAFPYQSDSVSRDIKYENEQIEKRSNYFDAFKTIFNNCLNFNIDLQIGNEKPGGIAEQTAIKFINSLGGYNDFTPAKFEKIIHYLNKYFLMYYGAGNCNNGKKNYTLKFGRESSIVMYISTFFKSEDEITATLDELSEIANPDELTVVEKTEAWNGKLRAELRLWWD